ncbi:hypothetical protein GCM10009840_04180 [Pseudolysinimonas kribbensis]|uniref:Helix-turn-helix domain-containing protein n=1 Tax=Pseudolysinimonas kribbensis TaxID=433641 RepID=A0ABQ6K457_9MICO|nr:hypothetical protein [Pseudolysinimonas kribbensis]GMA94747.1 hypothetical protein GCM10025881_15710 [Pseudolysinimonas kribbensis]
MRSLEQIPGVDVGLYAAKGAVIVAARLELGNTAARLFLHMALECWDDEDNPAGAAPRRYFGRREFSAIALGFQAPENGSESAFRAVKRAVKELVDKGAIRRVRHGGNGMAAEYELQVPIARQRRARGDTYLFPVDSSGQGATRPPVQRASF